MGPDQVGGGLLRSEGGQDVRSSPGTLNGTEGLRAQNLSQILTMVHRHGPLSRSELTRRTGFNRSTVGALVLALTGKNLVRETEPTGGRVGRPSPIVEANPGIAVLAVNPDIDALTVGVVGLGGRVHARVRRETDTLPTLDDTVRLTGEIVADLDPVLAGLDRLLGVGIALPGLVNAGTGRVLVAPHLGWRDTDLTGPFGSALALPAVAANDASLGSLAESIFGAALGVADAVYLNGSASGIGGGIVTAGAQLVGSRGYGGELGHTLVSPGGSPCHCGRSGCLDAEVRLERLLEAAGADGGGIEALERLLSGDPGKEVLAEAERQVGLLAVALVDFVNIFDPELIVLGGFLGSLVGFAGARLEDAVNEASLAGRVDVRRAALGPELLLVGAAELAFQPLLASPA
ncbi:ROK family protein [Arthrobacter sp. KR32]|uniref:ROK family protein n=1 Tax=Arthrobacter bussei TaxID=2594179 RepID=A0A7X1TMW1_9MICC|nr:ROK family protein [Arthrobacter bussei]MPY10134.1 ROK family protein [Arthrobacter bussei]